VMPKSNPSSMSHDGRYVAFTSYSPDLVPGDTNNEVDGFIRDTVAGTTIRFTVGDSGAQGNSSSGGGSLSADGRLAVFTSSATNLTPTDTNGDDSDVFLRDIPAGSTKMVSVATNGKQGNLSSVGGAISADGRYVAFRSYSNNLVPNDTNARADIFLRDTVAGTTTRVSVAGDGAQANDSSTNPSISGDGRFIAIESNATNLVPDDTNAANDIFVRDTLAGTTTRVSVASDGAEGNKDTYHPSVSADGRRVVFASQASNLVSDDTNGHVDIFVHDLTTQMTVRVSTASDGTQGDNMSGYSAAPSISADGRYVAFSSVATNLVPADTNGEPDAFVKDMLTGITSRVSLTAGGAQGNDESGHFYLCISGDARFVAFESIATNLLPGGQANHWDTYVRGPLSNPYISVEASAALRAAGGLSFPGNALRLNAEHQWSSGIDLLDAVRIARKVAGLDANP